MEHFLAERYLAGQDRASLARDANRITRATTKLPQVRLVTTLYVPEDETCFYLFESDTADGTRAVGDFDRVVAVTVSQAATRETSHRQGG